jgi:hypothetical protein
VLLRYRPVPYKYRPVTKKNIMTWPPDLCTFLPNMVCYLIKKGVRVDLGFKVKYVKDVEESVPNYCSHVVALEQIYNHIRHWRTRWVHVCSVKNLEEVRWWKRQQQSMMPTLRTSWFD